MSGSENGANHTPGDRSMVSPDRTIGARSASPAKRSAADMEEATGQKHVPGSFAPVGQEDPSQKVPGSFTNESEQGPTDYDIAMAGMTPASNSLETQEMANSFATSDAGAMSVDTQATSIQENGESTNEGTSAESSAAHLEPYTTAQTDEQVQHVHALAAKQLDEGDRGVVISSKWLARVLSRASDNLKNGDFPKEAREGNVGPLDNSDIVPEGAYQPPLLLDAEGKEYIPLKPGLTTGQDIEVLPYEAHGYIIGTYGYKESKPIIRYAHDTAPDEATQTNVIYELYPPVITVRKVPHASHEEAPRKKNSALSALQARNRGQQSADDVVRLVTSRTEKFQKFLRRAKEAAGIPQTTKVKIWRLPNSTDISVDVPGNQQSGVLSPPASRDPSPSKPAASSTQKLVIDQATFGKMEIGRDLEAVEAKDMGHDANYNGGMTMEFVGFFQNQTMLLEEQIGGPAGGEFPSDQKKGSKMFLGKKNGGSKPGSTTASGRTSPAPGGMMTRGRTRKDGRTKGTVGLTNLGNTCYMNSALQCIRSVEELALYFLSNKYKPEINNANPLGHHGAMANAYAGVLRGIYDGNAAGAFSPNHFKKTLGGLQPLFSGYGQQDSQEFLSFLVDALHEDLNRIYKKPYVENPDSDDARVRDQQYILELGQTYRNNHAARNDSVAMDLFSGFYKNTMECPDCDKVSVTFDPYSLLTVQLPMDHAFQHIVTFVPLHGKPIMHQIDIDKNSSVKTLKEHIAKKHPGVEANRLWMAEVYSNKLYKIFDDSTTLAEASIQNNDYLFIYELEAVPKNVGSGKKSYSSYGVSLGSKGEEVPSEGMDSPKAEVMAVPIFQRFVNRDKHEIGMHPLYITLTREEAKNYDTILKKVLIAVQNVTSRPILREFEEKPGQNGHVEDVEDESNKEQNGPEDAAGVSDHSTQSEDGYVNVSLEKPAAAEAQTNGASPMQIDEAEGLIPHGFMDAQYFLSPALRNQLFEMKYSEGADGGLHCVAMGAPKEAGIRTMHDRVKPPRRASIQSSNSDESTTSTANSEENESEADADADADDADKPDIVLGGGDSTLSTPTVEDSDEEDPNIMPPSEQGPAQSRAGRRKNKKSRRGGKKNKRGGQQVTYGKKDRAAFGQKRLGGSALKSPSQQQNDSPYYIQVGECIILDWSPEAVDSVYLGDAKDPNEMRGHFFVDENGRNGEMFHDAELEARRQKRDERKKHGLDLEDCFVETGKREVLSEDNAWYCNRCKELRRATKTLEIWTLPDILVVHLKRFGGTRSFRDKIDVLVDYPIEGLDLNDKVGLKEDGKDYTYDLFAVDNHYGGLGGGHYTAMAKNFYDGEWYDYNDSITSKIGQGGKSLKSAAAYLLFYRRRSDKPLGPQYLQDIVNDFRNPPVEEDAADDESGEDRLGGPAHSSQHGSSSALAGAGVGVTSSQMGNGANGGAGAADRLLTQGAMTNDEHQFGGQGNAGWNFAGVDNADGADDRLLESMNDNDDADSNKAQHDDNDDSGFEDAMDYTNGQNSPTHGYDNYPDQQTILHLEGIDGAEDMEGIPDLEGPEDPPAADIHLEDARESDSKMDH